MKKFIKEKSNLLIIIVSILIIILIVLGLVLITKHRNKSSNEDMSSEYIFKDTVVELAGTKIISNDKLKVEHCLNDICISNMKVYSTENEGRIECTITNKTNETKSGYFKVIFGKKVVLVGYNELMPDTSTKKVSEFVGFSLQDANDYKLEKLSKEEKKSINK